MIRQPIRDITGKNAKQMESKMIVYFSTHRSYKAWDDTAKDTELVASRLLNSRIVMGCYKGEKELSIRVESLSYGYILELAHEYCQESILVVDDENRAYLIYLADMKKVMIGKFVEVDTSEYIEGLENWTYDQVENKYYTVR